MAPTMGLRRNSRDMLRQLTTNDLRNREVPLGAWRVRDKGRAATTAPQLHSQRQQYPGASITTRQPGSVHGPQSITEREITSLWCDCRHKRWCSQVSCYGSRNNLHPLGSAGKPKIRQVGPDATCATRCAQRKRHQGI